MAKEWQHLRRLIAQRLLRLCHRPHLALRRQWHAPPKVGDARTQAADAAVVTALQPALRVELGGAEHIAARLKCQNARNKYVSGGRRR